MRRSFSLLELMIALALLIAMGGLVMPALFHSLQERSFTHAADLTAHHLLLARAHAQRTGKPVEVVWVRQQGWLEARYFSLIAEDEEIEETDDFVEDDAAEGQEAGSIEEPWALRILPSEVSFTHQPPADFDDLIDPSNERSDQIEDADIAEAGSIRLVIFWPDGSARTESSLWLKDDHERFKKLVINPWTGDFMTEHSSPPEEER